MGDRDFRFKLDCAPQDVTPKALSQAVSAFARILSAADASDWRISRMELHSIDLAAKPVVVDERTERSFATLDTITRLATRDDVSRDEAFRFSGVFSTLSDLAKETNANITVSSHEAEGTFTPGVLTGINRLLIRGSRRSFGHVRGMVDKVILQRTHRTLGLVDHVTRSRVDVRFGPELDPIVKRIQVGMEVDASVSATLERDMPSEPAMALPDTDCEYRFSICFALIFRTMIGNSFHHTSLAW